MHEEKEPVTAKVVSPVKPAPAPETSTEPSTEISFHPKPAAEEAVETAQNEEKPRQPEEVRAEI